MEIKQSQTAISNSISSILTAWVLNLPDEI